MPIDTLVVIPTLNEAIHIVDLLDALLQDPASEKCSFVVVDGESQDGTGQLVMDHFAGRVEVISNPERNQAAGINLAVARSIQERDYSFLVRVDAHSIYSKDYISRLRKTILETGADSVVVPLRTLAGGGNRVELASSILFNNPLGNGGSRHRNRRAKGWVDHGHHAIMKVAAFSAAGGYDNSFLANEDAELDFRLKKLGYRIFFDGEIEVGYLPRRSISALSKQYYRNGVYRVRNIFKSRGGIGIRQVVAMSIVPVLLGSVILAATFSSYFWLFPIAYVLCLLTESYRLSSGDFFDRLRLAADIASLAAISQISFSAGANWMGIRLLNISSRERGEIMKRRGVNFLE